MKNILYLTNSVHLGGDTKCILKLCKELKKNREFNNIIIASKGGVLLEEFYKIGVKHYTIKPVRDKINLISNVLKIIDIVKKEKIDIIHSHHRMTTLLAKIVSKFVKVKVIHTQHLCIEDKFKLTNVALSNVPVIAVSNSAKNVLVKKSKLKPELITTIYNTIEVECNNNEIDEQLIKLKQDSNFIIAQISRAIDYKGVYDYLNIAKEVSKIDSTIKFLFIGDGVELNNMKQFVLENNLQDTAYLLGSKNNVIEYLKNIDLFLLCSYIEGLPLSPIEAFSQGIPVIATNIDGTNEVVSNNNNGFLVEPRDIETFVEKILYLKNHNEELKKFGNNAKESYLNLFNQEIYIEKHIAIYDRVLNQY